MGFANATAEARYAIDYGVARAELSMPAQLEFDQLTAQGYNPQRRAASGIANDHTVLTPPAAPAQARAATRPRLRPSATNIMVRDDAAVRAGRVQRRRDLAGHPAHPELRRRPGLLPAALGGLGAELRLPAGRRGRTHQRRGRAGVAPGAPTSHEGPGNGEAGAQPTRLTAVCLCSVAITSTPVPAASAASPGLPSSGPELTWQSHPAAGLQQRGLPLVAPRDGLTLA